MSVARRPRLALERGAFSEAQAGSIERSLGGLNAHAITYTPGDATQWASPAPTTVGEALDRLAVRIATSGTPA